MSSLAYAASIPAAIIVFIAGCRIWRRITSKPQPDPCKPRFPLQETCFLLPAEEADFAEIAELLKSGRWVTKALKAAQEGRQP